MASNNDPKKTGLGGATPAASAADNKKPAPVPSGAGPAPGGQQVDRSSKGPVNMDAVKKANFPIVVIMGGPGSGKGTQSDKIKTKYHFCHLSTGDLLRAEEKSGSERSKKLSAIMAKGELVPLKNPLWQIPDPRANLEYVLLTYHWPTLRPQLISWRLDHAARDTGVLETNQDTVMELLKEAMVKAVNDKSCHGFLVDGFPRDTQQAEEFTKQVGLPKAAIYFECSDEEMTKRLLNRGKTSGRSDDNAEAVKKRLDVFRKQTLPVIAFYKDKNLLKTIRADRDVDQIFADVAKIMDPLHPKHD